jgi:glycosyltransferase involved in cell wall biosynthesis
VGTLRVGIDVGKALGVADGIGTYSRLLISHLAELDDLELHLYDLHHDDLDERRLAERFPELPASVRVHPRDDGTQQTLDLFHAPAHRVPEATVARLVFTLHDLTFLSHPELHTVANRVSTFCALTSAVSRGAHFVAVSKHTRGEAVRLLALGEDRLSVVHSAADPLFRPLDRTAARAALTARFGLSRPYVLSVGSMEPRKNLLRLLAAVLGLKHDLRDHHALVVTGAPGWRNREIREALERAAAECTVLSTGEVSQDELVRLYAGAEVLVYPSLAEGFGLPVLEAFACGTPVITSSVSALPEIGGEAAVYVNPLDVGALTAAIERVLSDQDLRADLSRRGLERAGAFSWQATAEQTRELFRRVVGR